ncbi:electron transport complex subunit RsxC [Aliidiomarina quisquiliarum]|uniref:electron transport complex subunit RsxC n=1 Tax=Aliidiomarina quisquiliarum TaxID=2938947 RepID=UPI00208E7F66|nr:electron transport complex subunit RsxC [Aliidiomarina quisquiliarum]MCO4320162.1 electron transport complex subunit RsxC [Aliidiomarina quisquiliarum]
MSKDNSPVKLWRFHGGVQPPERKALANTTPIRTLPLPKVLYIPLRQHIGMSGSLCVQQGERVLRGQALTEPGVYGGLPIHAPTSGLVGEVVEHPSNHPSQIPEPALTLIPDGEHQAIEFQGLANPTALSSLELIQHLHHAGIAGLGGAGFPTAQKLTLARTIELLIINGVECEPYIVSDDRLMREHAATIIRGVVLLQHILQHQQQAPEAVIAVEDNKPEAVAALTAALGNEHPNIRLQVIPTLYPSGGEKQLIQVLTGKQVPARGYPADLGILMQNVGTAFAIATAIDQGQPLMERVVTLTGEAFQQPGTAWVLLGTPIQHLLECGALEPSAQQRIIVGGPMMGYTVADPRTPIIKTTNCILAPNTVELPAAGAESPCIRCGMCEQVCPASLLPQQLLWLAKAKDHPGLAKHNLADCIECGACAYVCPSEIPLVHYYRKAKAEVREEKIEQQQSEIARLRFEARQERLEREKQERLERHKQAAKAREKALAERAKQAAATPDSTPTAATGKTSADPIQAAIARAKAKRAAQQAQAEPSTNEAAELDPQKARVAAAIARAKAKRAEQQQQAEPSNASAAEPVELDPQKARVAAAVARAKAKRAAMAAESATTDDNNPKPAGDPNKP